MVDLVRKPGVEISQVITPTPVTPVTPALPPCIVGPAYEVVDAVQEGVANSAALISNVIYNQGPLVIPASSFPTNHADIDEVSVIGLTDEISATLVSGSNLISLNPDTKSAVLEHIPQATRPAIYFTSATFSEGEWYVSGTGLDEVLIDVPAATSPEELVDLLNENGIEAGITTETGYTCFLSLPDVSASYGPSAFIQIRDAGLNATGTDDGGNAQSVNTDIRVDGSGLYAEPAANADSTATIQYSKGELTLRDLTGVGTPTLGAEQIANVDADHSAHPAWIQRDGTEMIKQFPAAVDFTTLEARAATALRNGDMIVCDGVELGMILQIKAGSLEIGSVDTVNSTYNADGSILAQRYLRDVRLTSSFSPIYAYLVGRDLSIEEPSSTVCAHIEAPITHTANLAAPTLELKVKDITETSIALANKTLEFNVLDSLSAVVASLVVEFDENFAMSDAGLTEIVAELNAAGAGFGSFAHGQGATLADSTITLTPVQKGAEYSVSLTENAGGNLFTTTALAGTDASANGLVGATLNIVLDDSPEVFSINPTSSSVVDFVDAINLEVGYTLAKLDSAHEKIVFQSATVGRLSSISLSGSIMDNNVLTPGSDSDSGSGRPNPAISVSSVGTITLSPQIIRFARTGIPKVRADIANGSMAVAVSYRGLRLDLSSSANVPGLLQVSDITELVSYMSPVDSRNPLALGVYYALLNAGTGQTISALGVDDISSSEPEGTVLSYMRAANFIEAHEVYGVVPLSQSEQVIEVFNQHVVDMSKPTGKRERVLISAPPVPTRETPIVVSSGENAQLGSGANVVNVNDSGLVDALESAGVATDGVIPPVLDNNKEVVLSVEIGGEQRHYSVKSVSGSLVTVRVTGMTNSDGFYSTTSITADFSGATFSVFLRGAKLTVPGTELLDRNALATTVRDRAQQYANSRQLRLFPDEVQTVIGGVEQAVPMYYYGCAISGATASFSAETPFSRRSMLGFTNVKSYDLTPNQLDMISAGNAVIEVESPGLAPSIRMQSTTAPAAIESREYSIVKAVDTFAKSLRSALKGRVGLFNITRTYLDETSTIADVICTQAVNDGLLAGATITKLEQSIDAPDTIFIEVAIAVLYPANTIKITLMV